MPFKTIEEPTNRAARIVSQIESSGLHFFVFVLRIIPLKLVGGMHGLLIESSFLQQKVRRPSETVMVSNRSSEVVP